jgi:hypothetical protein
LLSILAGFAADLPRYEALRAGTPIQIDGKLDEPAWVAAPDFGEFQFPWWKQGAKERTIAKMLWDDTHVYFAVIAEDAHIAAVHREHDGRIPEDDCFEVMLAPDPAKPEVYFNIEWNVLGGYVDNFRPKGPKHPRAPVWDAKGVRIAGVYAGTLNDDTDQDRYWVTEAAIPLENFRAHMPHPLRPGSAWNLNLNRHGGNTNVQYSQWSAGDTPAPSFHTPHRFGRIVFSGKSSPFGR